LEVCIPLLAVVPFLLLSGCDDAAPPAQAAGAAGKQDGPAMTQSAQQPAMPAPTVSPPSDAPSTVRRLFEEVKRLNAACVDAGGGVSGSPDCDQALAYEEELAGFGYCIDYPNDEALVRCPAPSRGENEGRVPA
jgi:hypothetical protein